MAIETIVLIGGGKNSTVHWGHVTFNFLRTKNEQNWQDYLDDADKILDEWDKDFNPIGI